MSEYSKVPKRVQRKRTKGSKLPPKTLCCTRPSLWSNPYKVVRCKAPSGKTVWYVEHNGKQVVGSQDKGLATNRAIQLYRKHIQYRDVSELLDYDHLACWCALDAPCHVDVLIDRLENEMTQVITFSEVDSMYGEYSDQFENEALCRICNNLFESQDPDRLSLNLVCPKCKHRSNSVSPSAIRYSDSELLERWNTGAGL